VKFTIKPPKESLDVLKIYVITSHWKMWSCPKRNILLEHNRRRG